MIPFARNKDFVGRRHYLDWLITKLYTENKQDGCLRAALSGLGGVGKTSIALELAFRLQEKSPNYSIFWVQASDAISFENSYRNIGRKLQIPGLEDEKADVKQLVYNAMTEIRSPWLMIIDNADDSDVLLLADEKSSQRALREYLPTSCNGAILFTTRDHKTATKFAEANVITIKEMNRQESTELLTNSIQAQKHSLLDDKGGITELLDLLLDLPLAIKQAAAYINENSTPISEYLLFYHRSEQNMIEVLSESFEDYGRYNSQKNPVVMTWLISFEQIRRQCPLAVEYLSFIGVLLQDNIPISLLPPRKSLLEQNKAIGTLIAYSFITRRTGEEAFNIHRLVYLATRNWLYMENALSIWADKALNRLVEVIPVGGHTNREVWMRYLPHGIHLVDTIEVHSDNEILMIRLLDRIGRCQSSMGQYIGAEKMFRETLALQEKLLGKEHLDTLITRNDLGGALTDQGKYTEAEEIYQETLALGEKALGKEHPDTLISKNNLGDVLIHQGKYTEAEEIHREELLLSEKVLGKEHPDTLISKNNLGMVLSKQGKHAEAEEMYREVLVLGEKVLGKEHPDTLISKNNLGQALSKQGKYAEAEEMHRETLALREEVLGKEHPSTLTSKNNLGMVLSKQGKYAEAEEMHWETLALQEEVLGKEHPSTLTSNNNLGMVLSERGKYAEAEEMHRETLALRKKVLGKEHPSTLTSKNNLGLALSSQGKYIEAEEMLRETLALREKVLGKEHPEALTIIYNLASLLQDQGNIGEAITLFQVELDRCEILYGPDHTETIASRRNLASILERYKEVNI